ncbi:MAG TPA: MFS transporter [Vicinamibacterales bacterium]|nr:MFS transporter [Vicinamibacterales bacterium]
MSLSQTTLTLRSHRSIAVALVTFATFTDIVAYAIAIPVLPALSRKLGASPTMIGLLFASFGVTLLTVSIPMGAISDRVGRKAPIVGGLVALFAASLLFAFADTLPWLFAARLVQGAADGITWVVGFALVADLYDSNERGRVTGIVMMGTSLAVMIGPTIGGWLYEAGGIRLPFLFVALLSAIGTGLFAWYRPPTRHEHVDSVPVGVVLRVPAIAACAVAVVAISATISMLEPIISLHLATLGVGPGRVGMVYGAAAVVTTILHPFVGRMADRFGSRRMTMVGLAMTMCFIPMMSLVRDYPSAIALFILVASGSAFVITPSLTYMGEATTDAGIRSFGVAYGLYNLAWGAGLLGGPATGGFLYERLGYARLLLSWAPLLAVVLVALAAVRSRPISRSASPCETSASPLS